MDKSALVWSRDAIPLADNNGRLLENKVQVFKPGMEAQVCCRPKTELFRPVGLVEHFIRGDTGVVVAVTVCQSGNGRRALVHCINVTAQPQELCACACGCVGMGA